MCCFLKRKLDSYEDFIDESNTIIISDKNPFEYEIKEGDDYRLYNNDIDGPLWSANTKFRRAMKFDGEDDYIEIPYSSSLDISQDLTIEAWVYVDQSSGPIVVHSYQYQLLISSAKLIFRSGVPWADLVSDSSIPYNQWTHVAVVREDQGTMEDSVELYINGILDKSGSVNEPYTWDNAKTYIGALSPSGNYFRGMIDELKIYNSRIFPKDGLGNCRLLFGFEEGAGKQVFDRSVELCTKSDDGYIYGDALWSDENEVIRMPFDEILDPISQGWVFAPEGVNDLSGSGNDGSLNPIYTMLNNCDSTTDWTGTSLSIYYSDYIRSPASLKDDVTNPIINTEYSTIYDPSGSWDWSNNHVSAYLKSNIDSDSTTFAKMYIYDTSSNWRYWDLTFIANEWTYINCPLLTGDGESTTPPDLSLIDRIEFNFKAANTIPFYKLIDYILEHNFQIVEGKSGNALKFDGVNDYIKILDDNCLDMTKELKIDVWVKPDSAGESNLGRIISKYGGGSNGWDLFLGNANGKKLGLKINNNDLWSNSGTIVDGYWHHIIVIYEYGVGAKFYIDGDSEGTDNSYTNKIISNGEDILIGKWPKDNSKYFNGIIDEIKIINNDFTNYNSRCLIFDGIDDYVNVGDSYKISGFSALTIEAWVYPGRDISNGAIILCKKNEYKIAWIYDQIKGAVWTDYQTWFWSSGSGAGTVPKNQWTHIAMTWGGHYDNYIRLFINGEFKSKTFQVGTKTNTGPSQPLQIGKSFESPPTYWNGKIDDIRIYSCIKEIENQRLRISFDEGSGQVVKDYSGKNNDGARGYHSTIIEGSDPSWTTGKYGNGLYFGGNDLVTISDDNSLDITNDITIEAWIKPSTDVSELQYIIGKGDSAYNKYSYHLFLGYSNKLMGIVSDNGYDDPDHVSKTNSSNNVINAEDEWNHVAMTYTKSSKTIELYVNGECVSDTYEYCNANGIYSSDSDLTIGANLHSGSGLFYFLGKIDNVIINSHIRTFNEDTDGDCMTDSYEIIRSRFSDQYNPLEYNGRYALLVAPVREDDEIQYKYDITQMRYYLIANGWCDCDIIFLTCESNIGREGLTLGNTNGDGTTYAPWIDGEAYDDNLKHSTKNTAFSALKNGGFFELQEASAAWYGYYFAKPTDRDIIFIEFRDHGENFKTYAEDDYSESEENAWPASDVNIELNEINYKYLIFELDFCYSGNWINDVQGNERAIITSAGNEQSNPYSYLFYGRIRGDIQTKYSMSGNIYSETNSETENADGVIDAHEGIPIREEDTWKNGVISVREAHFFAEALGSQNQHPKIDYGPNVPSQIYI